MWCLIDGVEADSSQIPFDSTIPDHRPVLLGSTKIEEEEDEVDEYWDIHIPSTPISIVPTPLSRPANFISRGARLSHVDLSTCVLIGYHSRWTFCPALEGCQGALAEDESSAIHGSVRRSA
jgi:hypothetical protein